MRVHASASATGICPPNRFVSLAPPNRKRICGGGERRPAIQATVNDPPARRFLAGEIAEAVTSRRDSTMRKVIFIPSGPATITPRREPGREGVPVARKRVRPGAGNVARIRVIYCRWSSILGAERLEKAWPLQREGVPIVRGPGATTVVVARTIPVVTICIGIVGDDTTRPVRGGGTIAVTTGGAMLPLRAADWSIP